uniref:NOT5 protein (NOT5) n=1 Tax=Trypanosoma congolense (strain IL3000) TaxID=1068625 RepID=G0UJX2_TRYCI|nr:conserved hypothetical protein [Trypanosoma congolense IL3000]
MASGKKGHQDVDRLLKRLEEDISSYDSAYNKYLKGGSQAQKDRLESELRKEFKKLCRCRDSIKSLSATPEGKDPKVLDLFQRSLEKIDSFKACELEMRAKGPAKDGLSTSALSEPQQAQVEMWLRSAVETLRKQVESNEYDTEKNGRSNHGRNRNQTAAAAASRLQKRRFHLANLELLLKSMSSGDVDPEGIRDIRDRVEAVMRNDYSGEEEDNGDDENIYAVFGLDEQLSFERRRGVAASGDDDDVVTSHHHDPHNRMSPTNLSWAKSNTPASNSKTNASAAADDKRAAGVTSSNRADASKKIGFGSSSPVRGNPPLSSMQAGNPGGRDTLHEDWEENAVLEDDDMDRMNDDTFGDDAMTIVGPGSLADMAKATSGVSRLGDWEKGRPASLVSPPSTAVKKVGSEQQASTAGSSPAAQRNKSPSRVSSPSATGAAGSAAVTAAAAAAPQKSSEQRQTSGGAAVQGLSLHPPAAAAPVMDRNTMLQLVDMSLANLPHTQDVDRQRPFEPSNPTKCPPYYPQQVLPSLASPEIYRSFELETLFFIFYYHQNTYQQYCAAGQIKERSFRYHTQLNTWFKRNGQPKESLEGGERGSFQYFNYEETWRLEEKDDFTFDYKYLENELR